MNAHADLARMWLERGRCDRAEEELRKALAIDPNDAELQLMLAACLLDLEREEEALEAARGAVAAAPGAPMTHVILSNALSANGKNKEALRAAQEAIALDPGDPDGWSAAAAAQLGMSKWKDAAESAERGLEIDPNHEHCLNLRAFANTQRGDHSSAAEDLRASLHHDPDNPQTHFNMGWAALRVGKSKEARSHFREALRLEPGWEAPREGLILALKSSSLLLRPIFWVLLQFTRVPPGIAFGIMVGSVFARSALSNLAESQPGMAWLYMGLFWVILGFILFSLLVDPLLNLALLLHPDGRYALDGRQKVQGVVVGLFLVATAAFAALGPSYESLQNAAWLTGFLAIGWSAALSSESPKLRSGLAAVTGVLTLIAVWIVWRSAGGPDELEAILRSSNVPQDQILAVLNGPGSVEERRAELSKLVPAAAPFFESMRLRSTLSPIVIFGSVALTWLSSGASSFGSGKN